MKKIDDEKIIKEVVDSYLGHPKDRNDYADFEPTMYADIYNDLGSNKPKYLDPMRQRSL